MWFSVAVFVLFLSEAHLVFRYISLGRFERYRCRFPVTARRHQPPSWMREHVKSTYELPRSYLEAIPAGQHPAAAPCSR